MKLSLLKQQLIESNNLLPKSQRRISSVRDSYKKNLNHLKPKNFPENNVRKPDLSVQNVTKDAAIYQQSNQLLSLGGVNESTTPQQNVSIASVTSPTIINVDVNKIDSIKIIGITGSVGKSTTAYIVHEYIKSLGYKSILYSSLCIDSPASYINANEPCEIPLQNNNVLLDIIEEAEAYQADYIVLEVNETSIEKGLANGIPFTVRALTNINSKHNEEMYSPEQYVSLKKSFFMNIPADEECTFVLGLTSFTREEFNDLLRLNNNPKITYGTKYICEVKNADYTNLDCLLYGMKSDLNGLEMKIRVKENSFDFKTSVILPHNALNFTCALAIIESLNLFNADAFSKCIRNILIPGREEVIKVNSRTIVIGLHLVPALKNFKNYQDNVEINRIKVVVGAVGTGFYNWEKRYSSELYMSQKNIVRRFAMDYLKSYANYAYLTSNDNAAESAMSIAQEMQSYINNQIPSTIVVDRKEAIRKAIIESEPNDLIYISGRGNRRIFCDTANTIKMFQDKEVVLQVLKEMGW